MKTQIEQLTQLLSQSITCAVVPHTNPDGDALGSCLGWNEFLNNNGHQSKVISPNGFPDFYKWMPQIDEMLVFEQEANEALKWLEKADVVFCLDYNDLARTGILAETLRKYSGTFVMIDHHQMPSDFAQITISNPKKSSTSEMVYDVIKALKNTTEFTPTISESLYTGILTDTGSFRFNSTTRDTHLAVADLIQGGASPDRIYSLVYDTNSLHRTRLLGFVLSEKLKMVDGLAATYLSLSQAEQDAHHFEKGDAEGFVNYGLSINGIKTTAFFRESDGYIKISLRSKGKFDVNVIARQYFNGGGHSNAAGGRLDMTIDEAILYYQEIMNKYANELQFD